MKKLLIIGFLLSVFGVQASQEDNPLNRLVLPASVAFQARQGDISLPPSPIPLTAEEMEEGYREVLSEEKEDAGAGGKWKKHQCQTCPKSFKTKYNLTEHIKTHTQERLYECLEQGCGQRFTQQGGLTRHIRTHTGEKPYECYKCSKKFSDPSNLRRHMRRHAGEKPFLTPLTEEEMEGRNFQQLEADYQEDSSQTEDGTSAGGKWKKHQCQTCPKSFKTKYNLTEHIKTHTQERLYECLEQGCGQRFTQQGGLTRHIRTHTEEKLYKCQKCDQVFFYPSALNEHMRKHTGEKPFPCPRCGQGFCRKSILKKHMNRKNPCVDRTESLVVGAAEEGDEEC